MVDNELISRKISQLREYLSALREAKDISWAIYRDDLRARAFVERYLHLCIEEVIDIGNHFISFHCWREPEGYRDLFTVLYENGVIPEEHLKSFQDMAAFRNLLVHRYDRIDAAVVYDIFANHLKDFDLFIALIKAWIKDKQEEPPRPHDRRARK